MTAAQFVALCLLCFFALPDGQARASPRGDVALRRFVMTVAANDGGALREPLLYAERDASSVSLVLSQLGGVASEDAEQLVQPRVSAIEAAFASLRARVIAAEQQGVRTEVLFYYSGHSDESALLLGDEKLEYRTLRQRLEELPTQVRIAILDSCASGAFTREKGGVHRPAFVVDASTEVRGHAFLTSSSATEAAQESDRIGGSFFTHYLVSGLRGAADTSGDRKITLTEAYRFAFDETLARTTRTQHGSQHPAYEIRLVGTGDLVMTDLRSADAELVLDESLTGRLFVWDARGRLTVEVDKIAARSTRLALPPGVYRVEASVAGRYRVAEVRVVVGQPLVLRNEAFRDAPRETTLARGVVERFDEQPFAASVLPPFSTNSYARKLHGQPVLNRAGIALLYDDPDALYGFQLGFFGVAVRDVAHGAQLATFFVDAGELVGLQLAGLTNVARTFANGAQLSLGANFVGRKARGLQLAGLVSYASELDGLQLALGFSFTQASARGLQVAALNLARDVDGVQLGAVNVARRRVRGVQLGVINYADEADVSIALLGITRQGGTHLQVSFDELFAPEIALRLDAKYNYSFVGFAVAPYGAGQRGYAVGAGVGAKIPIILTGLWLDVDASFHMLQSFAGYARGVPNSLVRLRALARYEIFHHLSVFAGPTLNVALQLQNDERYVPRAVVATHRLTHRDASALVTMWPGFATGLRF